MNDIYRVTGASVGETKNGYEVYRIQLNNSILATKLFPLGKMKKYDRLYGSYVENNNSIDFLIGRYVSVYINQTQYGFEISSIQSLDVIQDFKNLLDKNFGKAFHVKMNMYGFLKSKGYCVNDDGSVTLKNEYKNYNLKNDICYPNNLNENFLTFGNISLIYNHYYKDKLIGYDNPDREERYSTDSIGITHAVKVYHKNRSKIIHDGVTYVMRVGDLLTNEQKDYLINKSD